MKLPRLPRFRLTETLQLGDVSDSFGYVEYRVPGPLLTFTSPPKVYLRLVRTDMELAEYLYESEDVNIYALPTSGILTSFPELLTAALKDRAVVIPEEEITDLLSEEAELL